MSKLIDLTGQTINNWYVIERAPNRSGGRSYWKCKCLLCNKTIKEVSGHNLRSGESKSCGCQKMEKMRQACIKDETDKTYGFLHVLRQATIEEKKQRLSKDALNTNGVFWVCECLKCGNPYFIVKGDYLRNGDTKSCGCLNSYNETKIETMLYKENIKFKSQFSFKDLHSSRQKSDTLFFDFAILDNNNNVVYLIEYDGEQHFLRDHAWNDESYQRTVINDNLKNEYCFNHNIPLIRLPYNKIYNKEDLYLYTTRYLLTKNNIEEYYKDRDSI